MHAVEWALAAKQFSERRAEPGAFLNFANASVKAVYELMNYLRDVTVQNFNYSSEYPGGPLSSKTTFEGCWQYSPHDEGDFTLLRTALSIAEHAARGDEARIEEALLAVNDMCGYSVVESLTNLAEWGRVLATHLGVTKDVQVPRNIAALVRTTPKLRAIKRFDYPTPS